MEHYHATITLVDGSEYEAIQSREMFAAAVLDMPFPAVRNVLAVPCVNPRCEVHTETAPDDHGDSMAREGIAPSKFDEQRAQLGERLRVVTD